MKFDLSGFVPVFNYETTYLVNNVGQVWSIRGHRFLSHSINKQGYHRVTLSSKGKSKTRKVYHLVLEAFGFFRDSINRIARHLNGNPEDNHLSNLKWGTSKQNAEDMLKHGRCANANKTHCNNGHPYDEENTFILKSSGKRSCKTCRWIWEQEYISSGRRAAVQQKASV